jgi:uncharacterized membrane protein YccC
MAESAVAKSAGVRSPGGSGGAPGQPASPWWRVSWSQPAALRAVRATIVVPLLFGLTFKVIANEQMTLFAVFGSFAQLITVTFGGTRRDKAIAHLVLAVAGVLAITIGTLASSSALLAALVTIPVAFAIYFAGSAGPGAAAGVTPCLFAYILPIASTGTVSVLPSRIEGWLLASAASTLAVLLLSPRPPGDRLRAQAAHLATVLADGLAGAIAGPQTAADREAAVAAKQELLNTWVATQYRPIGLAAADQALAALIHLLEWCTSLIDDASDGDLDLSAATTADRKLLTNSVEALRQITAVLSGQRAEIDAEPIRQAQLASTRHVHQPAGDPAIAVRRAAYAFHAQAIGVTTAAAMSQAMIAARHATAGQAPSGLLRAAGIVASDASLRSVWFRNSARGAIALAAAVAVAKITDVEHAFWVVLGTLSVLRTSATATGQTALRGLAGTVAGFAVGAALLVGVGTSPTALWIAFPLAVLVAAYAPGTAPFAVGQAAFTVTIVVLFNLLVPAGWQVGLLRVEDVGIGCAVSLVVGFLFWPRGASAIVGDNLADAFRSGASYLRDAASWALGDRGRPPAHVASAIAAGHRLDDAIRGYLTEQGAKKLSKADLWALVMGAMRLRLTARSIASLPGADGQSPTSLHDGDGDGRLHLALARQVAELASFYDNLAAEVARPSRTTPTPPAVPLPRSRVSTAALAPTGYSTAFRPDALWVGLHFDSLAAHAAGLIEPAERLAIVRRRPWWR